MGQFFSRRRLPLLICLFIAAVDLHLLFIIKGDFASVPNTKDWFCMEWMGILTEIAIGLIWYKFKKD